MDKKSKLHPSIRFKFNVEDNEEISPVEFEMSSEPTTRKNKVVIVNKNERKGRDISTNNSRLF